MRTLTLAAILLAFLFSGYVCVGQRYLLPIPLDGTYGATVISTAQSLNGVTATVQATTVGFEICFPASGEVEYDWVDNQVASESQHGEGALVWANGDGTYYQGSEALIGCSSFHELHWQRTQQWQNADGDAGNDGLEESSICVYLLGAAYEDNFLPCTR